MERYKRRFNEPFVMSPYLRTEISRRGRKKARAKRYKPRRTMEEFAEDLRRASRAYDPSGKALSYEWLKRHDPGLASQACKALGSWSKARRAFGLTGPLSRKIAAAVLAERLRRLVVKDEPLTFGRVRSQDPRLASLLYSRYGTLTRACRTLGVSFKHVRKRWTDAEICRRLRAWHKSNGVFSNRQVRRKDPRLSDIAYARYGTWAKALQACGLDIKQMRRARAEAHRQRIAGRIKAWARAHGGLDAKALKAQSPTLYGQIKMYYGGARAAAHALGVPYRAPGQWSRQRVIELLKERIRKGRSITGKALRREFPGLRTAAIKYCGSWRDALALVGRKPDGPFAPTAEERRARLHADMKAWVAVHGELSWEALSRTAPGLAARAKQVMGGIHAAAMAWKLPVRARALKWTKETVRAEILRRIEAGMPVNAGAVSARGFYGGARKCYGSWAAALAAAQAPHAAL